MKKLRSNLYSLLQGKSRKVVLAAMPSVIVVLIFSLLLMAGSCEKQPDCDIPDCHITPNEEFTLKGTKWKLEGIVDTETGALQVFEPTDCEKCYTLTFDTDGTFRGQTTSNLVLGSYEFDYNTCTYHITTVGIATDAGEVGDGYLYSQILCKVQSCTVKTYLHLYNDSKTYLQYKKIDS